MSLDHAEPSRSEDLDGDRAGYADPVAQPPASRQARKPVEIQGTAATMISATTSTAR